jgi:hypothetical protein
MKIRWIGFFIVALLSELGTSWWVWGRAPTDSLRVLYGLSFLAYMKERLIPWLIIFAVFALLANFIGKRVISK